MSRVLSNTLHQIQRDLNKLSHTVLIYTMKSQQDEVLAITKEIDTVNQQLHSPSPVLSLPSPPQDSLEISTDFEPLSAPLSSPSLSLSLPLSSTNSSRKRTYSTRLSSKKVNKGDDTTPVLKQDLLRELPDWAH
ncbi:hypothetical protein RCL1_007449 [Eukaryota sp. TZLM3-RCL]